MGFFKNLVNGQGAKFITAIVGTVASALTEYYGDVRWVPAVVMVLTAFGVYLVPNAKP